MLMGCSEEVVAGRVCLCEFFLRAYAERFASDEIDETMMQSVMRTNANHHHHLLVARTHLYM